MNGQSDLANGRPVQRSDRYELTSPFPSCVAFATCDAKALSIRSGAVERETYRLGRAAALRALALLGCETGHLPRDADGCPRWPDGFVGSITHTRTIAAAAVARARCSNGIGLDVEDVTRLGDEMIEAVVADAQERDWSRGDRVGQIRLFSAKEAVFKAFFPLHRCYFGFDAVHLDHCSGGFVATLRIPLADWPARSRFPVRSQVFGDLVLSSVLLPGSCRSNCTS